MKKILSLSLAVLATATMMAQTVSETTVKVGDITAPAYTVTLSQDEDLVSDALKQRLKEAKVKTTKSDGFTVAKSETLSDIYSSPINFYAKVDEQGRRGNKSTVVTFASVSADLSANQNTLNSNTQRFLASFVQYVARYEASQKLEGEQKNLQKAQKALSAATATVAGLDKDIKKSEEKIASKNKDIEKLNEKIASYQKEIKNMEADIQKYTTKKTEAEKKVADAEQAVSAATTEVEKFKALTK